MRPRGKYWPGHVLDPDDPPTDERGYVWEPTELGQMMCTKAWDLTAHERLAALRAKMQADP